MQKRIANQRDAINTYKGQICVLHKKAKKLRYKKNKYVKKNIEFRKTITSAIEREIELSYLCDTAPDEELINILISNGYPAKNKYLISSVIEQIENFSEVTSQAFLEWINNKNRVSFEINGITADFLRNVRKQSEIAVLLSYDKLLKEKQSGSTEFSEILKEKRR